MIYSLEYAVMYNSGKLWLLERQEWASLVVKNPPANAGNTGSSPGPGGSHMLQSN